MIIASNFKIRLGEKDTIVRTSQCEPVRNPCIILRESTWEEYKTDVLSSGGDPILMNQLERYKHMKFYYEVSTD